jgi:hypothetical protein
MTTEQHELLSGVMGDVLGKMLDLFPVSGMTEGDWQRLIDGRDQFVELAGAALYSAAMRVLYSK